MGQQQLLLLVLTLVLVGMAVVTGISMFEQRSELSRRDLQVEFLVELSSRVALWKSKPAMLGGGAGEGVRAMGFTDIGFPQEPTDDKLYYRIGVGCSYIFPVFNGGNTEVLYSTVRVYDLDACPERRDELSNDDMVLLMRIYDDHLLYRRVPTWNWVRMDL